MERKFSFYTVAVVMVSISEIFVIFTFWKCVWDDFADLLLGDDIGKASFCEWEEAYCTQEDNTEPGN